MTNQENPEKFVLKSEQEMLDFGKSLAENLTTPAVFEFVGDVGTGKTTITRGLAKGLNIQDEVTSPSFTISKSYAFTDKNSADKTLTHYDFYRLPDPGLMADDLQESISDPNTITVVEWAGQVDNLLPENTKAYRITLNEDNSRTVEKINHSAIDKQETTA